MFACRHAGGRIAPLPLPLKRLESIRDRARLSPSLLRGPDHRRRPRIHQLARRACLDGALALARAALARAALARAGLAVAVSLGGGDRARRAAAFRFLA